MVPCFITLNNIQTSENHKMKNDGNVVLNTW